MDLFGFIWIHAGFFVGHWDLGKAMSSKNHAVVDVTLVGQLTVPCWRWSWNGTWYCHNQIRSHRGYLALVFWRGWSLNPIKSCKPIDGPVYTGSEVTHCNAPKCFCKWQGVHRLKRAQAPRWDGACAALIPSHSGLPQFPRKEHDVKVTVC